MAPGLLVRFVGGAPLLTRVLAQHERAARVRDPLDRLGVREPCRVEQREQALMEPRAVAPLEFLARDALRRVLGMEVERQPLDLSAEPALEPVGPLEADVAERSYVVAPDGDARLVHARRG